MTIPVSTEGPSRARRARAIRVDLVNASAVSADGRLTRIRPKSFGLLARLACARVEDPARDGGWVTATEIAAAPQWEGIRTASSLHAQIRREIKWLASRSVDVIESHQGSSLKGPFRLRHRPRLTGDERRYLAKWRPRATTPAFRHPHELFTWLEAIEPVWRSAWLFDKGEAALLELPAAPVREGVGPLVATVAWVSEARRLRDLGKLDAAFAAMRHARRHARDEANESRRRYLSATCWLHVGWLEYRRGRYGAADRAVSQGVDEVGALGHLKLLGQLLSLRSLLLRRRRRFADALHDLSVAAECFAAEADVYHLFSVYHNLSCLVAERAAGDSDDVRRQESLRQAIVYARRSDDYCRRYAVGQNSIVTRLLLASLHARLGEYEVAAEWAQRARTDAVSRKNWVEAVSAHRAWLRAAVSASGPDRARRDHAAFRATLGSADARREADRVWEEVVAPPVTDGARS